MLSEGSCQKVHVLIKKWVYSVWDQSNLCYFESLTPNLASEFFHHVKILQYPQRLLKPTDFPEWLLPKPSDLPKTENRFVQLQPSAIFTIILNPLFIYITAYSRPTLTQTYWFTRMTFAVTQGSAHSRKIRSFSYRENSQILPVLRVVLQAHLLVSVVYLLKNCGYFDMFVEISQKQNHGYQSI